VPTVRLARSDEYDAVGLLTVSVYVADGVLTANSPYVAQLRDARRRALAADLLVATESAALLGTVTLARAGSELAELAGPGEAELRMLAVAAAARGRGVGRALVGECIRRARTAGDTVLVLSTMPAMQAAGRLYARLGFIPDPGRNWEPAAGVALRAYRLSLPPAYCDQCGDPLAPGGHPDCGRRREFEPPRYCPECRRRMVVQVSPRGWTARCTAHGLRAG
jgi:GNAT superfamily N-acetyltransferase